MGKQQNEWMREEIAGWAREGLISPAQEEALGARYPVKEPGTSWGMIVFSCLGAVIVGLGIILLLAYNWAAIPKFAKLGLIIGAVAAVHAAGLRLFFGTERFKGLGEGVSLLGTMLFGAGIFLVAQIYHIDEHYPNAFLYWGLGALLMALAMPSTAQAILATLLLSIWSGTERLGFDTPLAVVPLILVGGLAPLAYFLRSRLLVAVVLPALLVNYGFLVPPGFHHPWPLFSALLGLSGLLLALAFLARGMGAFPASAPILAGYGGVAFFIMLFLLCFPGLAHELFHGHRGEWNRVELAYWALPMVLCLLAWIGVGVRHWQGTLAPQDELPGMELYLVPLTMILCLVDLFGFGSSGGWMIAGPFNLVYLALAVPMMVRGCKEGMGNPTMIGSVLLVLLLVSRYFDLFESLLVRGLVFILIGGVLLTEGILFARAKRRKAGEVAP